MQEGLRGLLRVIRVGSMSAVSCSVAVPSSTGTRNNSPCWQPAMGYRRSSLRRPWHAVEGAPRIGTTAG